MDNIALLILGVFISFLGIVNIMGNISTIHSYNRRRVKEEDVPKYGRAVGTGTLIIGASLIAAWCCTIKVDIENSKGQYIEKDKQEATKDGSESTKIQHGI